MGDGYLPDAGIGGLCRFGETVEPDDYLEMPLVDIWPTTVLERLHALAYIPSDAENRQSLKFLTSPPNTSPLKHQ